MITLTINQQTHEYDGDPQMPLLWYLRDELLLKGTKYGCGMALCGACTVHVDGNATRSCRLPMAAVSNAQVTTIEGLDEKHQHPLQIAWAENDVPQCGYCQSGQIMQAASLLAATPKPDDTQIDQAMAGNICRCGTYPRIKKAIKQAAGGDKV
ncbi:(2Fe-2S)-binding protein [Salinimonas sediminis]|uniref:(2Fe-2S)-binding protein n=1 Tax=Salinimonas sediminis TaxID=2303538 RepID=A0A346NN35_9ALTE|nr:(2Fe-2S)-binding protein [Salinimonas sediminis]AXR06942.1 (2Fe-2S)-binding protein [Salinimonas sediminis]